MPETDRRPLPALVAGPLTPARVFRLQRAVGNRAVGRLLHAVPHVQRAVGFEFETSIDVWHQESNEPASEYGRTIFKPKADPWLIKNDNAHLEFVTDPLSEDETGRKQLDKSMTAIEDWVVAMTKVTTAKPNQGVVRDVSPETGDTSNSRKNELLVIHAGAMEPEQVVAAPQATGGVPLEQVTTLMESLLKLRLDHLAESPSFKSPYDLTNPKPEKPKREFDDGELDEELRKIAEEMGMTDLEDEADANDGAEANQEEDELEKAIDEEYQATLQMWSTLEDAFDPVRKTLGGLGVAPEEVPITAMGMNAFDAMATAEAVRLASGAVDKIMTDLEYKPGRDYGRLKGLVALVVSYLLVGSRQDTVYSYSKQIAPLMSRTNFHALYGLLDHEEKALFTPDFVLKAAGLDDGFVFAKGFGHEKSPTQGPKRWDWITSIARGTPFVSLHGINPSLPDYMPVDLLSAGSKSGVADEGTPGTSTSMGAQAKPDDSLKGVPLAVLELRRLPKPQSLPDWRKTAFLVFDVFQSLSG